MKQLPTKKVAYFLFFSVISLISCKKESPRDTVRAEITAFSTTCDTNRPQINAKLVPVGTSSQAGAGIIVTAAGNKILFAGEENTRVDIYDFAANTWSTAELSAKRGFIATVAAGNKIFFAGGLDEYGWSLKAVDIYDVTTNTWSQSRLSREADGLAAATVGNKVFFAGGNWGIYAMNAVDIYDLVAKTWSTAFLSTPRNFITAVSANNKVYFTGGDPWTGKTSNVIDVYDNTTGLWSTSTMLVPRAYHAAIAVNDILYFAGGSSSTNSGAICSVETFNTKTGARTTMNLSGPTTWGFSTRQNAVIKNNKILFFRHTETAGSSYFDIYDISSNSWSIGVLPVKISGAAIISTNNTIYLAGGFVNGVSSNQVYKLEF